MKYVRADHARKVIQRVYPEASNIRITQTFKSRVGWRDAAEEGGYPLKFLPNLFDSKVEAVQLRLQDRNGVVRHPDYRMEEFVEEFKWQVGDQLTVRANQNYREAYVLAVIGDEALIEYEMPGGTTALWVIDVN